MRPKWYKTCSRAKRTVRALREDGPAEKLSGGGEGRKAFYRVAPQRNRRQEVSFGRLMLLEHFPKR